MPPPIRIASEKLAKPQLFHLASRPALHDTSSTVTARPSIYRTFGTTALRSQHHNLQRRRFYRWLKRERGAQNFKQPRKDGTNYITCYDRDGFLIRGQLKEADAKEKTADGDKGRSKGLEEDEEDLEASEQQSKPSARQGSAEAGKESSFMTPKDYQPFPQNPYFKSQPILSTNMRDEIYARVMGRGKTVRQVSQEMQVDMRRVAAVVRMKTMEMNWVREGKPLALPYQTSLHAMIPTTPLLPDREAQHTPHEPINPLPVHNATKPQLFHPTHESHQFTRSDAAKTFSRTLLPADSRIPHPDLVVRHREQIYERPAPMEAERRREAFFQKEVADREASRAREEEKKERHRTRVEGRRWQFVFEDCYSEEAGRDGRGRFGIGARYGVPKMDRRKGEVKIPVRVET